MEVIPTTDRPTEGTINSGRAHQIMEVALSLEAAFLAEMLKSAGVGETPDAFGGGSGEDQFASFLREEQAKQMAQAGGIGLAQALFESMMAKTHAQ